MKTTEDKGVVPPLLGYVPCPNCGTSTKEDDFEATFKYESLIKCPNCDKKIKPNNVAKISDTSLVLGT